MALTCSFLVAGSVSSVTLAGGASMPTRSSPATSALASLQSNMQVVVEEAGFSGFVAGWYPQPP
jgi:hypothetical protein